MVTVKKTTVRTKKAKRKGTKSPRRSVIALTGVNGFLGRSILQMLEADPRYTQIITLDYRKPAIETRKMKFYRVDLTETLADSKLLDIFQKESVKQVIHTAFPVTPLHNDSLAHELQSIGTMYLLNACASQNIKKLIVASTTDVYGAEPSNPNYLTEEHPPRGGHRSRFIRDKIDAENQVLKFARRRPEVVVTILRPCTILGPQIRNFKTNFVQRPVVFTVMGYDPLMQFVHEEDVVRAFRIVLEKDHPGVFNIVGKGVLPLSKVLYLSGKIGIPIPSSIMYPSTQLLWYANIMSAPPSHIDFLKYICVADGEKAERKMHFVPRHSSTEALLSFIGAERLRRVNLLREQVQ